MTTFILVHPTENLSFEIFDVGHQCLNNDDFKKSVKEMLNFEIRFTETSYISNVKGIISHFTKKDTEPTEGETYTSVSSRPIKYEPINKFATGHLGRSHGGRIGFNGNYVEYNGISILVKYDYTTFDDKEIDSFRKMAQEKIDNYNDDKRQQKDHPYLYDTKQKALTVAVLIPLLMPTIASISFVFVLFYIALKILFFEW